MSVSRKKAVVRNLSGEWVAGYLSSRGFLRAGNLDLLALDGRNTQISLTGVKWIAWVRDFNSGEMANPEHFLRKTFAGRPRTPGLLLRLTLSDGDILEGLAANDATLVQDEGIFLTPPDIRSNTQRLWVPRSAITGLEVLAVIGAARIGKPAAPKTPAEQESLF